MELLLELFNTVTLNKAIDLFAQLSLYSYPLLMFLNSKIQLRRLELASGEHTSINSELRVMYVQKTLYWLLMLVLYLSSIMLAGTTSMANLSYPVALVYLGFSWGIISIEIKSILSSYKEVKSALYVPVLKRTSFWILSLTSLFKVYQLSVGQIFGAPSQIIAIIDLGSYGFIFISLFIFVYFDKKRNLVDKALRKSRKIVISMKDNIVRDERYRIRRNREITKTLKLLRLGIDLIGDERKVRDVNKQIRELELLLATSQ